MKTVISVTRNNRFLAYLCEELQDQIKYFIDKYGSDRIGVVMGTSTSGLSESEEEIKRFKETNSRSESYFYSFQEFGDQVLKMLLSVRLIPVFADHHDKRSLGYEGGDVGGCLIDGRRHSRRGRQRS